MPQIDDGALRNLQELLKEISQRANRLSALIGLEKSLLAIVRKFDDIYKIATAAAGPPIIWNADVEKQCKAELRNFRRTDFMEFAADVEGICDNYPPIAAGGASDPTKQVQAWLEKFKKDLNEIEKMIPQGPAVLVDVCRKFQEDNDDCILARKRMVLREVTTLGTLTEQVQDQLDIPVAV